MWTLLNTLSISNFPQVLSPNRFVLAVIKGSTSPVTLKASWYIIDDTTRLETYNTNLVNANGATLPQKPVMIPKTTLDINIKEDGLYSVCVSVNSPWDTPSEQTCSDIITVNISTSKNYSRLRKVYSVIFPILTRVFLLPKRNQSFFATLLRSWSQMYAK